MHEKETDPNSVITIDFLVKCDERKNNSIPKHGTWLKFAVLLHVAL